jgi:C-terminal processing protease CtpA/Prc
MPNFETRAGKVPSSGASTPRTPRTASMTSRPGSAKKVGIGLVITDSAPHRVTSVVPGGAAHACGMIREGDTLVAVDENSVEDLDVAGSNVSDVCAFACMRLF